MRCLKKAIRRELMLVAFVLVGLLAASASTALAAGSFTGGADRYPLYLPNDHTPVAIHFSASGLETNTAYYAKVRFCPNPAPGGGQQYGYDWNPATGQWVQERTSWLDHVQVTTNATGEITASAGWVFAKYGYELTSSGTPRYIVISLSKTGTADTVNSTATAVATVIDPRDAASWVHNGVATGIQAAKNASATSATASSETYSIQKTEAQGVDDDANGADDEDYGPLGRTGDFRLSIPSDILVDVRLQDNPWAPGNDFMTGPADVDVAVGADDTAAPNAPTGLTATPGSNKVTLDWTAATDNPGGSGVAGYEIYRWRDLTSGSTWTDMHKRIATVTAGTTSYEDTQVVNGQDYSYEVRSVDASTNVSPRSNRADATPQAEGTSLNLTSSRALVLYGGATNLSGELTCTSGPGPAGTDVTVWRHPATSATWSQDGTATYDAGTDRYVATRTCTENTIFQMRFSGDADYAACNSNENTVSARAYLGSPWTYPRIVARNRAFYTFGYLKPYHGGYTRLYFYRKVRGRWRYYTARSATNYWYKGITRYRLVYRLRLGGYYYVKAYHSDAGHAATWSTARVFYVR